MSILGRLPTVLHFSPHPDDELLGAPAMLFALRDVGWRVVNVPCGLGRPSQHERRRAELREAASRAGFELVHGVVEVGLSSDDDLELAEDVLAVTMGELLRTYRPDVVISPGPHDRHHAHQTVARAMCRSLELNSGGEIRWWLWEIWGVLELSNLAFAFGLEQLEEITYALDSYVGELDRNDYRRMLRARGEMLASLGPELVFGFGEPSVSEFVEIVAEVTLRLGRWILGDPRWFDPRSPLATPGTLDVTEWIYQPSVTSRFGPPGGLKGEHA
jgi:GlcNAc-PI de-N-acetylase